MKAARDRDDEFYCPARKEDILGRPQTRLQLWEEHITSPVAALTIALDVLNDAYDCWAHWSESHRSFGCVPVDLDGGQGGELVPPTSRAPAPGTWLNSREIQSP